MISQKYYLNGKLIRVTEWDDKGKVIKRKVIKRKIK